MIKKPNGWENVQAVADFKALEPGAYVCKIIAAKVATYSGDNGSFNKLEITLDIAEGDFKDYYKHDFDGQQREDKRWRGVRRLYLPTDDGSDADRFTQSVLKAHTEAVEDSNPGYRWDWDETKLKGKTVGVVFRLEEWSMSGKKGWKAQPFKFAPVDDVRAGKVKTPKFKAHKDFPNDTPDNYQTGAGQASSGNVFDKIDQFNAAQAEDDGDLPF